jgi:hypothetical protein
MATPKEPNAQVIPVSEGAKAILRKLAALMHRAGYEGLAGVA